MNMKVIFQNDREGVIDAGNLDQMISVDKIKMFMRSDGWAMAGISPVRGYGGAYDGIEKRGSFIFDAKNGYKIAA